MFSFGRDIEENKNIVESKKCTSILSGDHNLLQSLYLCGSLDVGNKCYCEVCSVTCQKKNDLEVEIKNGILKNDFDVRTF